MTSSTIYFRLPGTMLVRAVGALLVIIGAAVCVASAAPDVDRMRRQAAPPRPEVVGAADTSCDRRGSCGVDGSNARLPFHARNCFCDELCAAYDDCCADYRSDASTPPDASRLPRNVFSCMRVEEIDTSYEIYVVTRCPRGFDDDTVRENCEDDRMADEFLRLPVSGLSTGVLYRNAYCAVCASETSFLFWRTVHTCVGVGGGPLATNVVAPEVNQLMRCPVELLPPEVGDGTQILPRKCKSHVAECMEGGGRGGGGRNRNQKRRQRCSGTTSYVYDGLQVYRNNECARCNGVRTATCEDERTPRFDVDDRRLDPLLAAQRPSSTSLVIDFNTGRAVVRRHVQQLATNGTDDGEYEAPAPDTETVAEQLGECDELGQVYDPYTTECRGIGCGDGAPFGTLVCPVKTTVRSTTAPTTTESTTTTTPATTTTTTTTVATTTTTAQPSSPRRTVSSTIAASAPRARVPPTATRRSQGRTTTTTTTTSSSPSTPTTPTTTTSTTTTTPTTTTTTVPSTTTTTPPTTTKATTTTTTTTRVRATTTRRSKKVKTTTPVFEDYEYVDEYEDEDYTDGPDDFDPAWVLTLKPVWATRRTDAPPRRTDALTTPTTVTSSRHVTTRPAPPSEQPNRKSSQCQFLPLDGDYVIHDNRTVSLVTSDQRIVVYDQLTYVDGKPFACIVSGDSGKAGDVSVVGDGNGQRDVPDDKSSMTLISMFRLDRIQSLASLIGVLISIISMLVCLVAQLVVCCLRGACSSGRGSLLCLVACLLVAEVVYLMSSLVGFKVFDVSGVVDGQMCFTLSVASHYALLAAFFWLNVIAMDAARSAPGDREGESKSPASCSLFVAYSFYAWIAPAVIVGGSVASDLFSLDEPLLRPMYAYTEFCWLAGRHGVPLLFALPLAALTVADLILFAVAACRLPPADSDDDEYPPTMRRRSDGVELFSARRWIACGAALAVLLCLTWTSALVAAYLELAALWYVFIGLDAVVGLFVCLAYAATTDVFLAVRDCCGAHRGDTVHYDEMEGKGGAVYVGGGHGAAGYSPYPGHRNGSNGFVHGSTRSRQSADRSLPVPEYDEVISQETSI